MLDVTIMISICITSLVAYALRLFRTVPPRCEIALLCLLILTLSTCITKLHVRNHAFILWSRVNLF